MNGAASPCRKRSRCLACSCPTWTGAAEEGTGWREGDQSSMLNEKVPSEELVWGLRPGLTLLEQSCPSGSQRPSEYHQLEQVQPVGSCWAETEVVRFAV